MEKLQRSGSTRFIYHNFPLNWTIISSETLKQNKICQSLSSLSSLCTDQSLKNSTKFKFQNWNCRTIFLRRITWKSTKQKRKVLTGPHFFPATSTDTSPPIAFAAVIAFRVIGVNVLLLCSAITKVLWNLCNWEKTRDSGLGAFDNILRILKEFSLVKSSKCRH